MIDLEPIGFVHSERVEPVDDNWDSINSYIELDKSFSVECLSGLSEFSHIEVIYYFHKVDRNKIIIKAEHPRENPLWPKVGIFAQRKKSRPNLLGATISKIEKIVERRIYLKSFDAIDGTPVLDIKPVFREYIPKEIKQPEWVDELMEKYW